MKTKLFALFVGLLCLLNTAYSQSETLTGFNGRIKFTSFANNGLYVRGTLDDFLDQTNQYVASDIDSADVVWDNQGRRYLVHDVISSNLTQAVVDLSRIGGGSHIPTGVGFVSRETSNGLALVPPVNSTGISTTLASRVVVHNAKILEGLKYLPYNLLPSTTNNEVKILKWTGNGTTAVPSFGPMYESDTIAGDIKLKMDEIGGTEQSFFLGHMPNFPDRNYSNDEYGLYVSPNYYGEISLFNGRDAIAMYGNTLELVSGLQYETYFNLNYNNRKIRSSVKNMGGVVRSHFNQDTTGFYFANHEGSQPALRVTVASDPSNNELKLFDYYKLPNVNPSTFTGSISSIIWRDNGNNPSFLRSQHGVATGTTDGSGDLTVTFAAVMPDATYTALCQSEGNANSYTWEVHTKTTSGFKIRVRDSNTKAVITATSVTFGYEAKDY